MVHISTSIARHISFLKILTVLYARFSQSNLWHKKTPPREFLVRNGRCDTLVLCIPGRSATNTSPKSTDEGQECVARQKIKTFNFDYYFGNVNNGIWQNNTYQKKACCLIYLLRNLQVKRTDFGHFYFIPKKMCRHKRKKWYKKKKRLLTCTSS